MTHDDRSAVVARAQSSALVWGLWRWERRRPGELGRGGAGGGGAGGSAATVTYGSAVTTGGAGPTAVGDDRRRGRRRRGGGRRREWRRRRYGRRRDRRRRHGRRRHGRRRQRGWGYWRRRQGRRRRGRNGGHLRSGLPRHIRGRGDLPGGHNPPTGSWRAISIAMGSSTSQPPTPATAPSASCGGRAWERYSLRRRSQPAADVRRDDRRLQRRRQARSRDG